MTSHLFKPSIVAIVCLTASAALADVVVKPGESIQKAMDAAPAGETIVIDAGIYPEHLNITKPITLRGAGSDKTIIDPPDEPAKITDAEKIQFVDRLLAEQNAEKRYGLVADFLRSAAPPIIVITGVADVTLQGLRIKGPAPKKVEGLTEDSLVRLDHARGAIVACAIVGPFMNGVALTNQSELELHDSLVAAFWGTGVVVGMSDQDPHAPSKVHVINSDLRNCYHRCMTLICDGSIVEGSRISGSAWHGIRYDNCSPTITDCAIFANARCGIYASGKTHGTIRGNVFWKNEMDGVSCWFNNADVVEQNTFIGNLREGLLLSGDVKPTVEKNIFTSNPIAIVEGKLGTRDGGSGPPAPKITGNQFWKNEKAIQLMADDRPVPDGNSQADPKLANEAKMDFNSPDATPAGAHHAVSVQSPWPIQPEEKQIIPDGDTRDYQQWKKPS
jgi:hypothetical protein